MSEKIDIVDLTDSAYKNLSPVQLAMVRAAQSQKDKILSKAEGDKRELFLFMLSNNAVRSSALGFEQRAVDEDAKAQIEKVKNDLDYQLAYEALGTEGDENGPYRYPDNPNFNLSPSQRFLVVRNYYMEVTSDPQARLKAYSMDSLARSYLGEYYQTLYDLLASYC